MPGEKKTLSNNGKEENMYKNKDKRVYNNYF